LPVHLVQRTGRLPVGDRRPVRLAADNALNAHTLHQPRDRAAGHIETLSAKLVPDLANAIDPPVLLEYTPDLGAYRLIPARTDRPPGGISPPGQVIVIGGGGNRQNAADRLDPMRIPMRIYKTHHHFDRRSSSAIAKYAL